MDLLTQPNERRCARMVETHVLPLEPACPISGNPQKGSKISITYTPDALLLEVESLRAYVDSYTGGKGEIRSMEGMVQAITHDTASVLGVPVDVVALLNIRPNQKMVLNCSSRDFILNPSGFFPIQSKP
jgi:NADPH-dependent 7-cyano-7-deazaguanine reductase QueF